MRFHFFGWPRRSVADGAGEGFLGLIRRGKASARLAGGVDLVDLSEGIVDGEDQPVEAFGSV